MKNVLFLSGLFPEEIKSEIIKKSKYSIQFAADTLQKALINGLSYHYNDLDVLNFPFIGAYPTRSKIKRLQSFEFGTNFKGHNSKFINLLLVKNLHIYENAKFNINKWASQNTGPKVIFVYALFLPFLNAAIAIKRKHQDVKICLFVPDLLEYMNPPKNIFYALMKRYLNFKIQKIHSNIDSYVFITKYMAEKIPTKNKKWIVIEGIYDEYADKNIDENQIKKLCTQYILYSGNLAKRYGILELVEAFKLIKRNDLQLVICGDGDAKEDIIEASKNNDKITYIGVLDGNKVRSLQRKAALLVNPRRANEEFTKYSFPSKVLEYFGSGAPTLMYKLPGIPDEYYEYCFTIENRSNIEGIAQKIQEILNLDSAYLHDIGNRAKNFVTNEKNAIKQTLRIVSMLESNVE